jgi:hypothetical protein
MNSTEKRYLSQIFYPENLELIKERSYLVGWNIEEFQCCIGFSLNEKDYNYTSLQDNLESIYNNAGFCLSKFRNFYGKRISPPVVLGEWIPRSSSSITPSPLHKQSGIWLILSPLQDSNIESSIADDMSFSKNPNIRLFSVYSLGYKYKTSSYLISYKSPMIHKLQCFTLPKSRLSIITKLGKESSRNLKTDLRDIVLKINSSQELLLFVNNFSRKTFETRNHNTNSNCLSLIETIGAIIVSIYFAICVSINAFLTSPLFLLNWWHKRLTWTNMLSTGSSSLKKKFVQKEINQNQQQLIVETKNETTFSDISFLFAAYQQRCDLIYDLIRYCAIFSSMWNMDIVLRKQLSFRIYERLLELSMDILWGIIIGCILYCLGPKTEELISEYLEKSIKNIVYDTLEWFNNAPGGIKLNPMITMKLGKLVEITFRLFYSLLDQYKYYFLPSVYFIACLGGSGFSFQMGLGLDVIRIVFLPINISHILFSNIYSFLIHLLYSLWLLFRGQKKNILRNRVDTYEYDQGELLFGVLLFSIVFFALPNIAAYHYFFVILRVLLVFGIYIGWQFNVFLRDTQFYKLYCVFFQRYLLDDQLYLKLVSVREEIPNYQLGSPNISYENFEGFLQEFSGKKSNSTLKKLSTKLSSSLLFPSSYLKSPTIPNNNDIKDDLSEQEEEINNNNNNNNVYSSNRTISIPTTSRINYPSDPHQQPFLSSPDISSHSLLRKRKDSYPTTVSTLLFRSPVAETNDTIPIIESEESIDSHFGETIASDSNNNNNNNNNDHEPLDTIELESMTFKSRKLFFFYRLSTNLAVIIIIFISFHFLIIIIIIII